MSEGSPLLGSRYTIPTGPGTFETVECREVRDGKPVVELKDGRRLIQESYGTWTLWHPVKER